MIDGIGEIRVLGQTKGGKEGQEYFARALAAWMRQRELSPAQLAAMTGMTGRAVRQILEGEKRMQPKELLAILDVMGEKNLADRVEAAAKVLMF